MLRRSGCEAKAETDTGDASPRSPRSAAVPATPATPAAAPGPTSVLVLARVVAGVVVALAAPPALGVVAFGIRLPETHTMRLQPRGARLGRCDAGTDDARSSRRPPARARRPWTPSNRKVPTAATRMRGPRADSGWGSSYHAQVGSGFSAGHGAPAGDRVPARTAPSRAGAETRKPPDAHFQTPRGRAVAPGRARHSLAVSGASVPRSPAPDGGNVGSDLPGCRRPGGA